MDIHTDLSKKLNEDGRRWYQTHLNTGVLLRVVVACIDIEGLSGDGVWQLMRLTWITHSTSGVASDHWKTLKIPALAKLFSRPEKPHSQLGPAVRAMDLPPAVESAAIKKAGCRRSPQHVA